MRHLSYRPASNFKRSIAFLIDMIPIQFGLYLISYTYFGISPVMDSLASQQDMTASWNARVGIEIGALLIWLLYSIVGELSPWRGTFGKKMMGICVKSIRGGKLTFGQVMARNGAKILSALPCYLGFFAAFFVYGNRAWHDSLSKTAVVDIK